MYFARSAPGGSSKLPRNVEVDWYYSFVCVSILSLLFPSVSRLPQLCTAPFCSVALRLFVFIISSLTLYIIFLLLFPILSSFLIRLLVCLPSLSLLPSHATCHRCDMFPSRV